MKKLKMAATQSITFKEGCNKYPEYCRRRNLREGTIGHYKQSYTQFYKYFLKFSSAISISALAIFYPFFNSVRARHLPRVAFNLYPCYFLIGIEAGILRFESGLFKLL